MRRAGTRLWFTVRACRRPARTASMLELRRAAGLRWGSSYVSDRGPFAVRQAMCYRVRSMAGLRRKAGVVRRSISLDRERLRVLDALAASEARTRSQMVRVL